MIENTTLEIVIDPHENLFPDHLEDIDRDILEKSHLRLQIIYSFAKNIWGITNIDDLLKPSLKTIMESIDLERCFIAGKDKKSALLPLITHNIDLSGKPDKWPVSQTIIRRVLSEGKSLFSIDALDDDRFSRAKSISLQNIRSVLCVPLGAKNECSGIIYVDNRQKTAAFTAFDLQFLTAFSHYIDLGLRNSEKFTIIQHQKSLSDARFSTLQKELLQEHRIVGGASNLLEAYDKLKRVSVTNMSILLLGETGTGKDLFAKAAHRMSKRSNKVFLPINLAEKSSTIIESELFGHEKGAFTGAHTRKIGLLEMANGGTLFLDEVGEIPLDVQSKLLRVLETGEFMRAGGLDEIKVDVRLICATNKNLETAIREGTFREDLYYRLDKVTINIPPLRLRPMDIPELLEYVLEKIGSQKRFNQLAIEQLQHYGWPGNVRELISIVEALNVLCDSHVINTDDLPKKILDRPKKEPFILLPLKKILAQAEENHMRKAMEICRGDNNGAIKLLGVARATFFERKKRYGLR